MFNRQFQRTGIIIIFAFLALISNGCKKGETERFEREDLFNLSIGKMENQLNLFELPGIPFTQKVRVFMQDGFFYISNGNSTKIMQFNSYGDLLSLLYNPDNNPLPVLLSADEEEGRVINKKAYSYPFNTVGEFCVTPGNTILVEDTVPEERQEFDDETGAMLNRIILRFDREGNLLDYLGQEGVGGTPFPYIERLQVTGSGEIAVITQTAKSRLIFWFSAAGALLYEVAINYTSLPVPQGMDLIPSLETVYSDADSRVLYLKLDYYLKPGAEGEGSVNNGTGFEKSRIYILDLQRETYVQSIELPRYFIENNDLELVNTEKEEGLYEFKGAASGGYLFFLGPDVYNTNQLLILDSSGRVVDRKEILIQDNELIYRAFHLSRSGILSAILCEEDHVKVVWWRSDEILQEDMDARS